MIHLNYYKKIVEKEKDWRKLRAALIKLVKAIEDPILKEKRRVAKINKQIADGTIEIVKDFPE